MQLTGPLALCLGTQAPEEAPGFATSLPEPGCGHGAAHPKLPMPVPFSLCKVLILKTVWSGSVFPTRCSQLLASISLFGAGIRALHQPAPNPPRTPGDTLTLEILLHGRGNGGTRRLIKMTQHFVLEPGFKSRALAGRPQYLERVADDVTDMQSAFHTCSVLSQDLTSVCPSCYTHTHTHTLWLI